MLLHYVPGNENSVHASISRGRADLDAAIVIGDGHRHHRLDDIRAAFVVEDGIRHSL